MKNPIELMGAYVVWLIKGCRTLISDELVPEKGIRNAVVGVVSCLFMYIVLEVANTYNP